MEGDEGGQRSSFKVQDRRRFSATGEAREDVAEERAETPSPGGEPAAAVDHQSPDQPRTAADPQTATAPHIHDESHPAHPAAGDAEITFASFVFSLSTQVLVHLGEVPDPIDGSARIDLEGARQIIDILAILAEKTRGNLDAAESSLLESALYDLRMRYVDRARNR